MGFVKQRSILYHLAGLLFSSRATIPSSSWSPPEVECFTSISWSSLAGFPDSPAGFHFLAHGAVLFGTDAAFCFSPVAFVGCGDILFCLLVLKHFSSFSS